MLRVDKASVWFAGRDGHPVHALDRVSLDIPEGAIVVALGTSGCGKSTLLNAMAGFLPLSSGSITLNRRAFDGSGRERGVVFQKDALPPWTVVENVELGLKFAGLGRAERRARALELLRLVGLREFAEAAPYELSGGMRQRVGIAWALATDPAILLMDEPFGALDSMTREAMQELLVDVWSRTGKQIFFITHSIEEALFLGTSLIVMSPRPGRIVARFDLEFVRAFARDGDARKIKSAPNSPNCASGFAPSFIRTKSTGAPRNDLHRKRRQAGSPAERHSRREAQGFRRRRAINRADQHRRRRLLLSGRLRQRLDVGACQRELFAHSVRRRDRDCARRSGRPPHGDEPVGQGRVRRADRILLAAAAARLSAADDHLARHWRSLEDRPSHRGDVRPDRDFSAGRGALGFARADQRRFVARRKPLPTDPRDRPALRLA